MGEAWLDQDGLEIQLESQSHASSVKEEIDEGVTRIVILS
jgi:hypothetical protein